MQIKYVRRVSQIAAPPCQINRVLVFVARTFRCAGLAGFGIAAPPCQIYHALVFVARTFRCAGLAGLKTRPSKAMQKIDCHTALTNKSRSGFRSAFL